MKKIGAYKKFPVLIINSRKTIVKAPAFVLNGALYISGVYSTATDLAKFIIFQFGNNKDNKFLLSANKKAMIQAFNIGWRPYYPLITNDGAILDYHREIDFYDLIKLGKVILTNNDRFWLFNV